MIVSSRRVHSDSGLVRSTVKAICSLVVNLPKRSSNRLRTSALSEADSGPWRSRRRSSERIRRTWKMRIGKSAPMIKLGDKLKLIPGHSNPTINLHDWYVGYRNNRVEALWSITARGAFF